MMGLTGQHLVLGDILYELPPDRVWMLQRIMPVCDTYPANLAVNPGLQPIWNQVIRRPFEQWNVVGLFNWNEKKDVRLTLKTSELGLSPRKEYLLFDFWNGKSLGSMRGSETLTLKKQSCRLLAVREKLDRPQLLSIDRHVTQGGICVRAMEWDGTRGALNADMDLPRGDAFTVTLRVPRPYRVAKLTGKAEMIKQTRDVAQLRVKNGRWSCRFAAR
jgi:hypothetical protein